MCCELSVTRYTRVVLMEIVSASTFVINIITAAQLEDCYLPPCFSLLIVIHHQLDQHLHLLQIEYNQPTDRYLTIYYYTPQFHVISMSGKGSFNSPRQKSKLVQTFGPPSHFWTQVSLSTGSKNSPQKGPLKPGPECNEPIPP